MSFALHHLAYRSFGFLPSTPKYIYILDSRESGNPVLLSKFTRLIYEPSFAGMTICENVYGILDSLESLPIQGILGLCQASRAERYRKYLRGLANGFP